MLTRYAEERGFETEVLSQSRGRGRRLQGGHVRDQGQGRLLGASSTRAATHRVQRVPKTESQGRIHTSTATVAVLPEAEEVDVAVDPNDLQIDVYRSSGPGGQSVNTTDSAVRITHKPTGIVVSMQDEKSQLQNRDKAMRVLRARLLEQAIAEQQAEIAAERRAQVGTGERSEKVRTYNFPQGRVTDHRIKQTSHALEEVLAGEPARVHRRAPGRGEARKLEAQATGARRVAAGREPARSREALARATDALRAAGVELAAPRRRAAARGGDGLGRAALAADPTRRSRPPRRGRSGRWSAVASGREPVAYILGRRGFRQHRARRRPPGA